MMVAIYDMTDTWNSETVYNAIGIDVLDISSASGSKLLNLKINGASRATIDKDSSLSLGNSDSNIVRMLSPQGSVYGSMYGGGAGPDIPHSGDINTNAGWGFNALKNVTTGGNTAFGYRSLYSMTSGVTCTALGYKALESNVTGTDHTAVGVSALGSIVDSVGCTAVGMLSLKSLNTGGANTGVGDSSLVYVTSGSGNTAVGYGAGEGPTQLEACTLLGRATGTHLETGAEYNTFVGAYAGSNSGNKNDAVYSTCVGANAIVTKDYQVVLGASNTLETLAMGCLSGTEQAAAPPDPPDGQWTMWMGNGTSGPDGDIMIKITASGVTKTATIISFADI